MCCIIFVGCNVRFRYKKCTVVCHWHCLARKIWLENAIEMAQFARSIQT